jgi:hypothetical protein
MMLFLMWWKLENFPWGPASALIIVPINFLLIYVVSLKVIVPSLCVSLDWLFSRNARLVILSQNPLITVSHSHSDTLYLSLSLSLQKSPLNANLWTFLSFYIIIVIIKKYLRQYSNIIFLSLFLPSLPEKKRLWKKEKMLYTFWFILVGLIIGCFFSKIKMEKD